MDCPLCKSKMTTDKGYYYCSNCKLSAMPKENDKKSNSTVLFASKTLSVSIFLLGLFSGLFGLLFSHGTFEYIGAFQTILYSAMIGLTLYIFANQANDVKEIKNILLKNNKLS